MKWLLFFCLFFVNIKAQEPIYFNLDKENGLPDKTVYDIVEDANNFIWLATESGIYRYDGNNFLFFTHPKQVGLSVFNLTIDNENTVWYNNLSNQLFRIKEASTIDLFLDLNEYFKGENTKIVVYGKYIIVIGTNEILVVDKKDATKINVLEISAKKTDLKPVVIDDFLYILNTKNEWFKYSLKNFTKTQISQPFYKHIIKRHISASLAKKDSTILFLETSLLKSTAFKFEKKLIKSLEIVGRFTKKRIVNSCIIDNLLWVCAQDGLYIYELSDRKIVLRRHLFKDKLITKVIKDNLDNYWVASHDKGLFIIPNIAFNTIKSNDFMSDIKHHYNTNQDFYIQDIDNRLFKFSTQTKTLTKINHKAKRDVKYVFENPFSSEINVTTIKKNNILNSSDLSFNKSKEIRSVYKEVNFINQNVFLKSSNRNSVFFKLETNGEFFGKPIFKIPGRSYANAYCKALKKAYFANINGLYVVDSVYQKQEILINGQRIFAKDIVINSDNEIWVLCFKNKILKIKNDEVVEELNLKNGLLNEINSHIYFYDDHLWILGNSGIQVYNQSTKRFVNITKQDGLPSYDFKGINIKDDIVFITSSKEIIYFTIGAYKKQIKLHNPYITKVVGNGTNIKLAKNVEFPSEIEKVDVFFNTNGLFSKETINYKFKLNDGKWENLNKGANVVSFNRISSGSYNLKIVGFYDGLVSAPIDFNFIIQTPFYKNWIFILAILIFTTALIWYFLSKKNKRIQLQQEIKLHKQNQELENINLKLENLRSQMNPHFIFNALNSIQDYILRNETTLARHFLVKFSRLIRMYLEHTQRDSLVLNEEIEALTLYLDLEKDRFSKDFNYSINLCKNTNPSQINLPPFLIQPYVENAIKHGLMHKKGAKNLTLNFNIRDKNIFICEIIDDGIGFQKSRAINQKQSSHKSFSTGANNKRIELLNKTRSSEITLQIVNLEKEGTTSGTKIVLKIPQ